MKLVYLLVNFCTILVPFVFSFHRQLQFNKRFRSFFLANGIAAVLFIIWDVYFTHLGIWGFNADYITGIHLLNLPLEEILFFICIPFSCIFTYHCLTLFHNFKWSPKAEDTICLLLIVLFLLTGFINFEKAYTASTFISLGILLAVLKYIFRVSWLSNILSIYPVLLFPFFIVNGILTGTGLEQPVVWYNDGANLGIRIGTIPVEDIFYGFELILLNLFLYQLFVLWGIPKNTISTD